MLTELLKDELKLSGTDIKIFTAHSCRSASVSNPKANGMGINEIMKRGCWKSDSTFKNFYDKDIINNNSDKLNYESIRNSMESKTSFIRRYSVVFLILSVLGLYILF